MSSEVADTDEEADDELAKREKLNPCQASYLIVWFRHPSWLERGTRSSLRHLLPVGDNHLLLTHQAIHQILNLCASAQSPQLQYHRLSYLSHKKRPVDFPSPHLNAATMSDDDDFMQDSDQEE